jgi:hypothetical protein
VTHSGAGATTTEDPPRVVGVNAGRVAWAAAAFDVLVETAARHNAVIVYSDLAEEVQRRTGLSTRSGQQNWIGTILGDVVRRCHGEGLPALTALVVRKDDGQVGIGYDLVLSTAGLDPIADQLEREEHAARARLECYRRWCPDVPADAVPTLSDRMIEVVQRRRPVRVVREPTTCDTCHYVLPLSGVCPECQD